jgi:hypothetical protein
MNNFQSLCVSNKIRRRKTRQENNNKQASKQTNKQTITTTIIINKQSNSKAPCGGEDGVEALLDARALLQRPIGLLLMAEDHIRQNGLAHASCIRVDQNR